MYQRQSFGDVQWLVIRDSGADAMRLLGVYDAMVGNTARLNKVQWIGANIEPGRRKHALSLAGDHVSATLPAETITSQCLLLVVVVSTCTSLVCRRPPSK